MPPGDIKSDITIVVLSFCTGIAFIYGVEGLSLTDDGFFKWAGLIPLLVSLGLALKYLYTYFKESSLTSLGLGLGSLLMTLMLYVMSVGSYVKLCHVFTAKILILALGTVGLSLFCLGALYLLEEMQANSQSSPPEPITSDPFKNLILVVISFFSLLIAITEFVIHSASKPC